MGKMFRTKKDVEIAEQKSKIENDKRYINDLQTRIRLKESSNNRLREEKVELKTLLSKIADYVFESPLSDELVRAKLKELTRDYQSEN